jgi:hypothetical protein
VVDLVGASRVEVAEGIVRDPGEVYDRVESLQIRGRHITDVLTQCGNRVGVVAEDALREKATVQTDDLVPGLLKQRHEDRPDITVMACN